MEDFVTYEVARKLKEKGFKEECLSYYTTEYTLYNNVITLTDDKYLCVSDIDYEEFLVSHNSIKYTNGNYVDAPTISQVLKWLRDDKNIHINVGVYPNGWNFFCCSCEKHNNGKFGDCNIYETLEMHNSYELAALAGIEYVLDNLI